jgi:serine/threonine-protein kinase MRCK
MIQNRLMSIANDQKSTTSTQSIQIDRKNFKILKVLGKGAFGEVYHVTKLDTGEDFAMKKLNKFKMMS